VLAYKRDLENLESYLNSSGWQDIELASNTALMSYVLHLHKTGKHAATISRSITVIKGFYKYLYYERIIDRDNAHLLKTPKFTRQPAPKLSAQAVDSLLSTEQNSNSSIKTIRDRAIIAVISSTGMQSAALIDLTLGSLDLSSSTLNYQQTHEKLTAKLDPTAQKFLQIYTDVARAEILTRTNSYDPTDTSAPLFVNMKGESISRQGLWKIIKEYGQNQAQPNLSPRLLRGAAKND